MKIENLSSLRVLVWTARRGSLTAASEELGITPSAASALLKRLESTLGARMFVRSTRTMRLTVEGREFLSYASRALDLIEEGEAQLADSGGHLRGLIRLSVPSDLTRSVLLPLLDEFLELHPGIELLLSVSDRMSDLMKDEVDIALRYGNLSDSRLVARPLFSTRRVLVASPGYLKDRGVPREPGDLVNHNCLTYQVAGRRYVTWAFEREGRSVEVRVSGNRSADDAALAHQWALAGAGVTYKSELDLIHDLQTGSLVRLLPDWNGESYPLNTVLPSARFLPGRIRALIEYLAHEFQSGRKWPSTNSSAPTARSGLAIHN